ncbi:MAG TPA: DUF2721 domain-containing protein [Thermoanaerobaculia bacterium]|nr:DUF2721 domain-containing protein [Thermoanaerobaculia bacterium]
MRLPELIPILQIAIGPVILVSGVGLLLLTMTNRLGRIIDRTRQIARDRRAGTESDPARAEAQLAILLSRAAIVRGAIAAASFSVLLAAILIIVIFVSALFRAGPAEVVALLFVGCMGSLIVSLVLFIRDINLSLRALRLEVGA